MKQRRPVKTLPPEVSRKIAAGEVIDRPNAIVRELMDNAVDAGASAVTVEIDGGGIDRIRISDNGNGMTKEDLENCARPHATSKIDNEKDLLYLGTLGFRGEALASMAAVCRLQIISVDGLAAAENSCAWKLQPAITGEHIIVPAQLSLGTVAQTEALFENFPARRQFLKRPAAEAQLCRQTFIEKALPRTDISFRLIIDGKQKQNLPAGQSFRQRFVSALEIEEDESLFTELYVHSPEGENGSQDWQLRIIIGDPSVRRSDRRYIYIYANGRRISEYSLVQAIEYGGQGYFPNGTHPVAAVFLEIRPDHVDFNIHPAKREARFRDLTAVHKAVSRTVREFFRQHTIAQLAAQAESSAELPLTFTGNENRKVQTVSYGSFTTPREKLVYGDFIRGETVQEHPNTDIKNIFMSDCFVAEKAETEPLPNDFPTYHSVRGVSEPAENTEKENGIIYLGTVLGVFLAVEKDDKLYLIDQHAAHERILFNRFITAAGQRQRLLVPYVVETSCAADDEYLRNLIEPLDRAGFDIEECGGGRWEFSAVPVQWHGTEDDLKEDLLTKRLAPADLLYALAGTTACRAAVKDGHFLDKTTAASLAAEALSLSDPHCPHGRPLWTVLSKAELFRLVRRTE